MKSATLGLYSVDPPALDAFHSFDPESFVVLLAISDALIAIGPEGDVVPSLAVSWEQTSPVTLEMQLREGVSFHNGEPFDADSVLATFHHHHHPAPSACGGGILSSITGVEKLGPYRIRLTTAFPDAMLLRRLFFFSVYPKGVLESEGRGAMLHHPIGTGAFRFVHWRKGEEILLARNPHHWSGGSDVEQVRIPIVRQKEWVDRLASGELDLALNIDSHDAVRAGRLDGLEVGSREAALSQWFLLANKGPLADVKVRRALNHAIKRTLIAEVSEHGLASPQRSVATSQSWGYADDVAPYRYSPELASKMLAEAGHADGFTLRGLVSETSTGVYFAVREFLRRVGVTLEAEIVPRSQWLGRILGGKLSGQPYDGDFAISIVDNPLLDSVFHQFIFLFSDGLFSLTSDADYDKAFLKAATSVGEQGEAARKELEHYAAEQALLLFTVQQQVHAAWRTGCTVPMPVSGHFDSHFWWNLSVPEQPTAALSRVPGPHDNDVAALLDATSHTGTFFLPESHAFEEPWADHLWRSLRTSEARWRLTHEPMLRELVTQIEARNHLGSILSSTRRVAIVGYSPEGQQRFANSGFDRMFGTSVQHVADAIDTPAWEVIEHGVQAEGSWLGPVRLDASLLPEGAATQLHLAATPSLDDEGAVVGLTLVFSDFSGEEERIRNQAIRVILDNVPYGLFMVDAEGRLRSGYSETCREMFPHVAELEGAALTEVLELDERTACTFEMTVLQCFDDWLPEAVSLGQIADRIDQGHRTLALSARVVRDADGSVDGLLFTCTDISELVEAEREVQQMKGTLTVLRFRDRFESYVREFVGNLSRLEASPSAFDWQVRARRELHTAKGVFGQFGLTALQHALHDLEDAEVVGVAELRRARVALQVTLDEHADVWGITLEDQAALNYAVAGSELDDLAEQARTATTLAELQAIVAAHTEAVRCRTAASILGPIEDSVRQLAERREKRVDVVLEGLDTRLPARLDGVMDQLGHLVRNSVDHGIETPDLRGNKPEQATLSISVAAERTGWRILVADDGRGIDADRVCHKAVSMGLVSEAAAAGMSRAQRIELLFLDGLSTAETVSDTSGRGVGMAAVRHAVQAQGGHISVWSETGVGTRFELWIPNGRAAVKVA